METWLLRGKPHRDVDPARTWYDPATQKITAQMWYQHGKLHRVGAPAYLEFYPDTGVVKLEMWCLNDGNHRVGAPAEIHRNRFGVVIYEEWMLEGEYHRDDGPSVVIYYRRGPKTGQIARVRYADQGHYSRPLATPRRPAKGPVPD